ncbi:MAG: hypothetical protein GXY48_08355 [Methanomicrobiales archaeon]|nr:hypothetical protein [Methanomicrobiales archaeon]
MSRGDLKHGHILLIQVRPESLCLSLSGYLELNMRSACPPTLLYTHAQNPWEPGKKNSGIAVTLREKNHPKRTFNPSPGRMPGGLLLHAG